MKIDTLREFLHLATESNFSTTARHFFISQSALSKHIYELEKELDAQLFLRDKHVVRLTSMGKLFVIEAREIVKAHDSAIQAIKRAKRHVDSVLQIGYLFGASRGFLPHACSLFAKEHPNTEVGLHSLEPEAIMQMLNQNEIDLGISIHLGNHGSAYEYHRIYTDSFCVVVPENHRLAMRSRVSPEDLANELFLIIGNQPNRQASKEYLALKLLVCKTAVARRRCYQLP